MGGGGNLLFNKIITTNTMDDSLTIIEGGFPFKIEVMELGKLFGQEDLVKERMGPRDLLADKDGNIYVLNSLNDSLLKIDMDHKRIISSINLGRYPKNFKKSLDMIYIINSDSNSLSIVNKEDFSLNKTIGLGNYPSSLDIGQEEERIYISNLESDSIEVLDFQGWMKKEIRIESRFKIRLYGDFLYVLSILDRGSRGYSRLWVLDRKKLDLIWSMDLRAIYYDFIWIERLKKFYLLNPGEGYLYSLKAGEIRPKKIIYIGKLVKNLIFNGKDQLYINDIIENRIIIVDIFKESIEYKIKVGREPQAILLL